MWDLIVSVPDHCLSFYSGNYFFRLNNDILVVVGEVKYLGVLLSRSGSFYANKMHLASQAEQAMYILIKKSRLLLLPIDLQIELFDKLVCCMVAKCGVLVLWMF